MAWAESGAMPRSGGGFEALGREFGAVCGVNQIVRDAGVIGMLPKQGNRE